MVGLLPPPDPLTGVTFPRHLLGELFNPVVNQAENNWHTGESEVLATSVREAGRKQRSVT